jgi:predicted alpha-1,2-mannosidase
MRRTLALAVMAVVLAGCSRQSKEPVDYVNPNIGGIGHLLTATSPTVQLPYSMMRIAPITTPAITDRYLADKIYGFPAGGVTLMPMTGAAETDPAKYASMYDHDLETTTPYYWSALLEKNNIRVEYTVSERAAYYRFTFPEGEAAHILLAVPGSGEIKLPGPATFSGRVGGGGRGAAGAAAATEGGRGGAAGGGEAGAAAGGQGRRGGTTGRGGSGAAPGAEGRGGGRRGAGGGGGAMAGGGYFYAEFSNPVASSKPLADIQVPAGRRQVGGTGSGIMADFTPGKGESIGLRLGMSYISIEQARQNLEREIPDWNFDQARAAARKAWSQEFGKIAVKGGTDEERTIFYTAMYRGMGRPTNASEYGKYYSTYDRQVHDTEGHDYYTGDNLWDTLRAEHPLQVFLDPRRQEDMARSYIRAYEQSGWFPRAMIGHHTIALITDLYMKGYRDFDVEKAYAAMKKTATEGAMLRGVNGPATPLEKVYFEKGFFPALKKGEKETEPEVNAFERRGAVSLTLEHCYDDWCLAQMAKALNKQDDYAYFTKRAHNYENLWDKRVGFMAPKSADGNWVLDEKEFDPVWSGGQGGRDYYVELNAWDYTFHVQHDVAGLINLMGGRDSFNARLDALFSEQFRGNPPDGGPRAKYHFLAWFPDQTGLIGQYSQGNEPSIHIPYLYNYAGQPWKTQRKVREIMKLWYNAGPLGICGDDDGGGLSSWYPLSAMGFYAVCPGRPVYDIGSPIFEETRIALAGGKVFTITARNVSAKNKYIQSAELNGKPLNKPWFEHADMANGGTLVLHMGPRANTSWGSAPEAAPPSMSQ